MEPYKIETEAIVLSNGCSLRFHVRLELRTLAVQRFLRFRGLV